MNWFCFSPRFLIPFDTSIWQGHLGFDLHYNKFMHCWFSILGKKFHTCFLGSHSGIFWRQHFPVRGTASHPATLTDAYVKDILSNDRDSRRFFHLMITESLIILREETVILLKGPTRPNIFLQIDLDSWTTCGSPLWKHMLYFNWGERAWPGPRWWPRAPASFPCSNPGWWGWS